MSRARIVVFLITQTALNSLWMLLGTVRISIFALCLLQILLVFWSFYHSLAIFDCLFCHWRRDLGAGLVLIAAVLDFICINLSDLIRLDAEIVQRLFLRRVIVANH